MVNGVYCCVRDLTVSDCCSTTVLLIHKTCCYHGTMTRTVKCGGADSTIVLLTQFPFWDINQTRCLSLSLLSLAKTFGKAEGSITNHLATPEQWKHATGGHFWSGVRQTVKSGVNNDGKGLPHTVWAVSLSPSLEGEISTSSQRHKNSKNSQSLLGWIYPQAHNRPVIAYLLFFLVKVTAKKWCVRYATSKHKSQLLSYVRCWHLGVPKSKTKITYCTVICHKIFDVTGVEVQTIPVTWPMLISVKTIALSILYFVTITTSGKAV